MVKIACTEICDQTVQTEQQLLYMKQQVQGKRQLLSFPPINVLIQRYNSLPSKSHSSRDSQAATIQNPSLLKSQKSSLSGMSCEIKKLYICKSSSYFKKSTFARQRYEHENKQSQPLQSAKSILRMIDSQNVIATYKAISQSKLPVPKAPVPKVTSRLVGKTENVMRISSYQDFSPFKRSHQISKKVVKLEDSQTQQRAGQMSKQRAGQMSRAK